MFSFRIHIFLFLIIFTSFYSVAQKNEKIEEYQKILSQEINDSTRINTLIKLAEIYKSSKSTYLQAYKTIDSAYQLARKKNITPSFKLLRIRADLLNSIGMTPKAMYEIKKLIDELAKTKEFQEYALSMNLLASCELYSGKFKQSIETYLENINFAEQKNLISVIPQAYLGISNVYNTLKRYKEEKKYLLLYLNQSLKENNKHLITLACERLGLFYQSVDSNFIESLSYYQKTIDFFKSKNDSVRLIFIYNSIAWVYKLKKQTDSSIYYYLQAIKNNPAGNLTGIANAYANIGSIYRDKSDFKNAEKNYSLGLQYALKTHDLYNLAWINRDISEMYRLMNDYKQAYIYYVLHKKYSDSISNANYQAGIADARIRYETETKEQELQLLNIKLAQHEYLIYAFAGLIFLLFVIGYLIFRQSRLNAKRKISEMNAKLSEITHANLRQQMNPHFIFNTLNSIQYYMYQHDKLATNNYLTKFSSLIRKILENSQFSFISIKDEMDVITLYLELETLRFKDKFTYSIHIDDEIDMLFYKVPSMLIQPYIENAVNHGLVNKQCAGLLTVDMTLFEHSILCKIEDNGIGREAAMEIKRNKNISHQSLGMKITESRIDISNAMYGTKMKAVYTDLKDENNQACGTLVELYLPIMT